MAQTSATLPGTGQSLGTGVSWTSPGGITSDGSTEAFRSSSGVSAELTGTNYGFTIPTLATINGILLQIEIRDTAGTTSNDNSVRLKKSGGATGDDKASATYYTSVDTVRSYGGASDLWGTTWTPSEINDSSFGAFLKTNKPSASGDIYCDYFKITIYYTVPSTSQIIFM